MVKDMLIETKKAKGKKFMEEFEKLDKDDQLLIIGGVRSLYMSRLNRESKENNQTEN